MLGGRDALKRQCKLHCRLLPSLTCGKQIISSCNLLHFILLLGCPLLFSITSCSVTLRNHCLFKAFKISYLSPFDWIPLFCCIVRKSLMLWRLFMKKFLPLLKVNHNFSFPLIFNVSPYIGSLSMTIILKSSLVQ